MAMFNRKSSQAEESQSRRRSSIKELPTKAYATFLASGVDEQKPQTAEQHARHQSVAKDSQSHFLAAVTVI